MQNIYPTAHEGRLITPHNLGSVNDFAIKMFAHVCVCVSVKEKGFFVISKSFFFLAAAVCEVFCATTRSQAPET